MLRRIALVVALAAGLAFGGLALLPTLVSTDAVRAQIAAEIAARTGWRVAFDGPVSLSVLPDVALEAERLRVESAPGAADALAADVERARFGLALAPLLSGEVRLTEIALERPVVRVVRALAPAAAEGDAAGGLGALAGVAIDRLSVSDGLVVLRDGSGETRIEGVGVDLAMPDPAASARIAARGRFEGRAVAVSGVVDSVAALAEGRPAAIEATIEAPGALAAPVAIAGRLALAPGRVLLRQASASAGESRLVGEVDLALGGPVPAIDARLAGPLLDLDALLPAGAGARGGALPLEALDLLVGDVELSLDRLRAGGREIAPAALLAQFEESALTLVVSRAGFAGGGASGEARIGREGATARVSGRVLAQGLALEALVPGPGGPRGRLGADLRFALAGDTPETLAASLNVAGSASLSEGVFDRLGLAGALGDPAADRLSDIALSVEIRDLAEPVRASGAAVWRGERVEIAGSVAARPLLYGGSGEVDLAATSRRFAVGYRGAVSAAGAGAGEASFETASLRGLLAWLGRPAPTPAGLERVALAGRLELSPGALAFRDARIALDGARGSGSGRIAFGARPRVEARLALDRLDVNPYFGLDGGAGGGAGAPWSEAPIDLSALRGLDADLALELGEAVFRAIRAGPVALAATLSGGRLEARLDRLSLYGGGGTGALALDASGARPLLKARFDLADLDARAFLVDAAGFDRVEGRGALSLDLAGTAESQAALMRSLEGSARFSVRDGALRGFDVTRAASFLARGVLDGWDAGEGGRTELFGFAGSFAVGAGVARTEDLRMVGPLVDMTGSGAIDVGGKRLALRLDPRIGVPRRGGVDLASLGAPVIVDGPWARPRIYPDVAGILQDPARAYEQLRALGGGLFGREIDPARALDRALGEGAARGVGDLLGLPRPAPPAAPPAAAPPPAAPPPAAEAPVAEAPLPLLDAPPAQDDPPPAEPPPPPPDVDPALDAARGLLDLLMRNP